MDFPGSATTNIHIIDGFSTIYWRIYTEEQGISNHPQDGPANGYTILKHLGRLKDLEARLRGLNCLASCPRRLGLWVFSSTPAFESLASLYVEEGDTETTKILVDTTTLKVSASGSVASHELIKNLPADPQNTPATQTSVQQRPPQSQSSARRQEGYNSSAAIYTSFISAVTGAISVHLIRSYGALPLGSRTLFTAVEKFGYESPRIDNQSVLSQSCLTTLNIQLNATGTLTISPQTISQPGITRLCSPRDDIADLLRVQPGTDIWLCPNGAIARLVTANIESPAIPSPEYPSSTNNFSRQQQWKLDVVQWLATFGLHINSIDEEPWVEVEVWEPFFARLAGETWRQGEDTQSTLPLKRMLWPARFCFKRSGPMIRPSCPLHTFDDPLEFAEQWFSEASSLKLNQDPPSIPVSEEIQMKDQDMASPQIDSAENLESLSRMAQYPDLQSTNMVYPTPPDGAAIVGTHNPNASVISPDDTDFNLSPGAGQDTKNISHVEFSPDLQVGTGRYDASDDEDLFGDMNDKDFGAKGITDADFNFFDDPDLETMDEAVPDHETVAETPFIQPDQQVSVKKEPKEDVGEEHPDSGLPEVPRPTELSTKEHLHKMEDPQASPIDDSMGLDESTPSPQEPKSQTISPPLSPIEIKKILFPGSEAEDPNQSSDSRFQQGHYHPIAFEKKIGDWDQKYGTTGKFWFTTGNALEASDRNSNSIPTIGMPHRGRGSIAAKSAGESAALSSLDNHTRSSSVSSNTDSDLSDDDAPPINAPTPLTMVIPSLKRKRVPSESDIQSVASLAKSSIVPENSAVSKGDNTTFLGNFLANFSDWTFIGYFSATQIQQLPVLLRREDQVLIAQLLVDQITQSSFDHQLADRVGLSTMNNENFPLETCLEGANFLGDMVRLDLKTYASLQEDPAAAQQPLKDPSKGPISKSFAPHVRVRRGKDCLEALPASISFWETFGLEPAHGTKNVSAYCIHPQAASNAADVFMDRFGLLYQSCNFGNHTRGDQSKAFTKGLSTWGSENPGYSSMMQSLNKLCEKLGTELAQAPSDTDNAIIYIVNPFPHAAALVDICAAFWRLFQQLAANADRQQTRQLNDVVLQIIPLEFIVSEDSMVVPTQPDYLNLALEMPILRPFVCAPAIVLADPAPKSIGFRLAAEKGSPLQDGRSLHLALSKSSDQRWISAAWSDGTGSLQMTMSYCLRYRSRGVPRPIADVRNEIWAATKHIMENYQARWKLVLANTEPMDTDDIEGWASLSEQLNKLRPGTVELSIVTVSAIPDLVLETPTAPMTTGVLNPHFSSTPVSTPNPSISIASPEQAGNAPTPGAAYNAPTPTDGSLEPDTDVVLTDMCDESWTVVLSHRLNNSHHVTELRPALVSGYLLRRKGVVDSDGVFAMTVNLVHTPRPSLTHETLLREILGMYRDLATLARVRGIRSVQNNTLPWHIATALRAQELLSYVL
ncbi:hypothetical protein N7509_010202 [Penicillium cosmopolitanum]|uniref:Mediator of RNA polymerase II transcription subunit 13 n=1 Tax=Penicillium cosmopolitanum TaxID=1131564 RepID=A0A9W9VQV1_9EURO|nr:uncharacterized protein N7509_010202 [Penicillium cosmopolitanum]KAJ5387661.1 hypothetical protein N7509_010202 [Penicillium cosmopolitanum]